MTFAGRQATLAPSLTAAQPASYSFEGRTVRPLGGEIDRAFALMATLDAGQRGQAILGYKVSDLVLGPGQDGRAIQPEGLKASAMSASQQTMLLDLAREWAGIANDALAAPRIEEIRAGLKETYFAWSGRRLRAAQPISESKAPPSSSSTRRSAAWTTSIPSIAIPRTTTGLATHTRSQQRIRDRHGRASGERYALSVVAAAWAC